MSWKNSFIIQQIAALFAKSEIKKDDIVEINTVVEKVEVVQNKKDTAAAVKEVVAEQVKENSTAKVDKPIESENIGIEDFIKLDLRIGTIVDCEIVAGSDKLLKSQVDFGPLGMRQVLSGVRKHYGPEEMKGKQGLFVVNLKPRKMMGFDSHGMMLFALDELSGLKIVGPVEQVAPGTKVG